MSTQSSQVSNQKENGISIIGLGLMGQALAGAFLKAGHPTTVWNRTAAKAEELVAQGATLADSIGDAVVASPLVVICVSDYDAVHELLDPLDDAFSDRVLVNLTSSSSEQARGFANWAASREITYLDGAIMALPRDIGTEQAIIFYSGPASAFEAHKTTLQSLSPVGATYLDDDHGLSSLYDVAILNIMWSTLNAFYHGATLLKTAGVEASTYAPIGKRLVKSLADWLPVEAQQIDDGTHLDPASDSTLDTSLAAMEHLIHESKSSGINADLPKFIKKLAEGAIADGHGGASYAAMIEQFRKPSA